MARAKLKRNQLTREVMQERVAQVDALKAKGLNTTQACEKVGFNFSGYYDWRKKLKGEPRRSVKVVEHVAGTLPVKHKKRAAVSAPTGQRLAIVMGSVEELSAFFRSVGV